jgi:hypothetical protein
MLGCADLWVRKGGEWWRLVAGRGRAAGLKWGRFGPIGTLGVCRNKNRK